MPDSLEKKRARERIKRADPNYRAKKNAEEKARYAASPAYREKAAARSAKWHKENPIDYKNPTTRERYKRYRWRANGINPTRPTPPTCENCGKATKATLNADHDHETGIFRGWLCPACNRGLGLIGDNANAVRRLLAYLERAV